MGANIEVKARANDWEGQRARAAKLTGVAPVLLEQIDTFFKVPAGRLKLRQITPEQGELIFYQRPDQLGPKRSDYSVAVTDRPEALRETLAQALGVYGEVKKRRWLYVSEIFGGHTRIHFDEVKGLGQHIELEVILQEGQSPEEGEAIAERYREALDILDDDLIDCAYLDLLTAHSGGGL
jgi:adenylate cyclase class IV